MNVGQYYDKKENEKYHLPAVRCHPMQEQQTELGAIR